MRGFCPAPLRHAPQRKAPSRATPPIEKGPNCDGTPPAFPVLEQHWVENAPFQMQARWKYHQLSVVSERPQHQHGARGWNDARRSPHIGNGFREAAAGRRDAPMRITQNERTTKLGPEGQLVVKAQMVNQEHKHPEKKRFPGNRARTERIVPPDRKQDAEAKVAKGAGTEGKEANWPRQKKKARLSARPEM